MTSYSSLVAAATLVLLLGTALALDVHQVAPILPNDIVDGAEGCGGSSIFVRMELTNCSMAPCDVSTSTLYDISITFTSAEDAESVNWLVFFYYPNGGVNRLADKVATGTIGAGLSYRIEDTASIPDRYNGLDGELSVMIMHGETGSRMTCGIFPVVVAPNTA